MQDVFEPTANFGGDVFEPMANFGGDVFEPMNFDGDTSNFADYSKLAESGVQLFGTLAQTKASNNASKSDIQKQIDTVCGSRSHFILKKKRNAYNDCKNKVLADIQKDKQQNVDLSNKQLELNKISLQTSASNTAEELKAKNKRNLILGLSIGGGVLVLGTILFFVLRKK